MFRQLPLLTTQIPSHGLDRPDDAVKGTLPKVPRDGFEHTTFGFQIQEILCTADLTTRPRAHTSRDEFRPKRTHKWVK